MSVLASLLCLLVLKLSPAHALSFRDIPNPQQAYGGYVSDQAKLLATQEVDELNSLARSLKQQNGAELAIATVPDLSGSDIETYAVKLFERWGVGDEEQDNGLLIVFAQKERKLRVEVGYGLEATFNDALITRLINEHAVPEFKQQHYFAGLRALSQALSAKLLATTAEPVATAEEPYDDSTNVVRDETTYVPAEPAWRPAPLWATYSTAYLVIFNVTMLSFILLLRTNLKSLRAQRRIVDALRILSIPIWLNHALLVYTLTPWPIIYWTNPFIYLMSLPTLFCSAYLLYAFCYVAPLEQDYGEAPATTWLWPHDHLRREQMSYFTGAGYFFSLVILSIGSENPEVFSIYSHANLIIAVYASLVLLCFSVGFTQWRQRAYQALCPRCRQGQWLLSDISRSALKINATSPAGTNEQWYCGACATEQVL